MPLSPLGGGSSAPVSGNGAPKRPQGSPGPQEKCLAAKVANKVFFFLSSCLSFSGSLCGRNVKLVESPKPLLAALKGASAKNASKVSSKRADKRKPEAVKDLSDEDLRLLSDPQRSERKQQILGELAENPKNLETSIERLKQLKGLTPAVKVDVHEFWNLCQDSKKEKVISEVLDLMEAAELTACIYKSGVGGSDETYTLLSAFQLMPESIHLLDGALDKIKGVEGGIGGWLEKIEKEGEDMKEDFTYVYEAALEREQRSSEARSILDKLDPYASKYLEDKTPAEQPAGKPTKLPKDLKAEELESLRFSKKRDRKLDILNALARNKQNEQMLERAVQQLTQLKDSTNPVKVGMGDFHKLCEDSYDVKFNSKILDLMDVEDLAAFGKKENGEHLTLLSFFSRHPECIGLLEKALDKIEGGYSENVEGG